MAERLPKSIDVRMSNRPAKFAFLVPVEDNEINHWILDGIFREAYSRWGGARSLIVPYGDDLQPIHASFKKWLEIYDPDFVYSYIDLSEEALGELDKLCLPISISRHELREEATRWQDFIPSHIVGFDPVGSISTFASPKAHFRLWREAPTAQIYLTQHLSIDENRFFPDNFGVSDDTNTFTYGRPGLFETICFCAEDVPENHNVGNHRIHDEVEVLSKLAQKQIRTFSRLASIHSEGVGHPSDYAYESALNIFIGSSVAERINFWNCRHFTGHSDGYELGSLILKPDHFENDALLQVLGQYCNNHNFRGQNSGPAQVNLYSSELSADLCGEFRDKLAAHTWNIVTVAGELDQTVFPSDAAFNHSRLEIGISCPSLKILESEQTFIAHEPTHFQYLPVDLFYAKRGQWLVDLSIERHQDDGVYSNVLNDWRLPRRSEVVSAFSSCLGKIRRSKELSLVPGSQGLGQVGIGRDYRPIEINLKQPCDELVFRYLTLNIGGARFNGHDMRAQLDQSHKYEDFKISDKGRNHQGIISLMGGDLKFANMLTNLFWRQVLRNQFNSKDERLANSEKGFTKETLSVCYVNDFLGPSLHRFVDEMGYLNARAARRFLKKNVLDGLEELVHRGVLFQQYIHSCNHCGNHNYLSLDTIRLENVCSVCRTPFNAPIDLEWRFSFSPYVLDTLVERSGLPVLWAAAALFDDVTAGGTSSYLPEVDLYHRYGDQDQKVEIDILANLAGTYTAVEVKTSAQQFVDKQEERDKFVEKMKRLRPDVACLAFEVYSNDADHVEDYKAQVPEVKAQLIEELKDVCLVRLLVAADKDDFNSIPHMVGTAGPRTRQVWDDEEKQRRQHQVNKQA